MSKPPELCTIGYQASTLPAVLAALREAGVRHLVDIRAISASRKPGFSRRVLEASVREAGMEYSHLRALGTPKPGREAARRGDAETLNRIYAEQLEKPEAQAELARAEAIAGEGGACLFCFERDHRFCHRDLLAARMRARSGARVVHLVAEAVGETAVAVGETPTK